MSDTDTDAVISTAQQAVKPVELQPGAIYVLLESRGDGNIRQVISDTDQYQPSPRRMLPTLTHHFTAESLSAYVDRFKLPGTAIYADEERKTAYVVIDGSSSSAQADLGWGNHRALLHMRETPAWKHWAGKDTNDVMMDQETFAQHIEDGLDEIVEPAAAQMLELAQSFHATSQVTFKSSKLLSDGSRSLLFDEQVAASAGAKGDIAVPGGFTLGLRPFEGSDAYKILARFRYRISNGHLAIGYHLDRPEDALRLAFNDVVKKVETATGLTAFRGSVEGGK